jgi:hypothetical protein
MTSDESVDKAVRILEDTSLFYPKEAEARAKVANAWMRIAEFLKGEEDGSQ